MVRDELMSKDESDGKLLWEVVKSNETATEIIPDLTESLHHIQEMLLPPVDGLRKHCQQS